MVCLFPALLAMRFTEPGSSSFISYDARYRAMAPVLVILWDRVRNKEVASPSLRQANYKNLTITGKYSSDGLYGWSLIVNSI